MREAQFQEQVFIASMAPTDPLLYLRMFAPEQLPAEELTDADLWAPESEDEWAEMVAAWEEADREAAAQGERRPFLETLPA